MLNLSPTANLKEIWEKGQHLCSRSWACLSSVAGQNCFRVPYMASIIDDGLCLGDKEIIFGPGDISWTLGAALVEGEHQWSATTKSHSTLILYLEAIFSPVFIFVLLLCLLAIVYRSKVKSSMLGKKVSASGACIPSYIYPKQRPN